MYVIFSAIGLSTSRPSTRLTEGVLHFRGSLESAVSIHLVLEVGEFFFVLIKVINWVFLNTCDTICGKKNPNHYADNNNMLAWRPPILRRWSRRMTDGWVLTLGKVNDLRYSAQHSKWGRIRTVYLYQYVFDIFTRFFHHHAGLYKLNKMV